VPEGDTIHLAARRMHAALAGKRLELADAPNPRSPLHNRARELEGAVVEEVEAFGKHLVAHFSNDLALHSHLGMNGRWLVTADGRLPYGRPWLRLASGRSVASQNGGKILRLVSESRLRNDPGLRRLGPDPLRPGFDRAEAVERLRRFGAGREIGDALLDQEIIAGIGNAIRVEALFQAQVSPWRKVETLDSDELDRVVAENERVMRTSIAKGRRPRAIYRANRTGGCPRCGTQISSRGQGDDNRIAYWCPVCQGA
jgi:endonuclease-8